MHRLGGDVRDDSQGFPAAVVHAEDLFTTLLLPGTLFHHLILHNAITIATVMP